MTDRQVANPGQYKAVVSLADLAKMQNGEEFVLHLMRDDNPLTEGTPYNKASVLPDELAKTLCPDVADPTPADAIAALLPLIGGIMRGSIDMGGNKITGLGTPKDGTDAVSFETLLGYGISIGGEVTSENIDNLSNSLRYIHPEPLITDVGTIYSGVLLTINAKGAFGIQLALAISDTHAKMMHRISWFSSGWCPWIRDV